MNLQKIKSAKNITYTDRYSKNTIINSLIKNKLQTEMVQIKESFANIIKKQQTEPQKAIGKSPLRRNKSYSINPKMIQQAITYDPIERLNRATELYVSNRQVDSLLIPQEQLRKINKARQEHFGLNTKLSRSDAINYDSQTNLKQLSIRAQEAIVKDYDQEAWLPKRPEIQYLLENKKEQIQEQLSQLPSRKYSQGVKEQLQKLTNRITGNVFTRSDNVKKISQFPLDSFQAGKQELKPTNYIPQKYHKNDYKSIEAWLDKSIDNIAKEPGSPEDKLNLVYSSYICVWKQLIRLTYIESDQKGLLLQKILYSMLRLFSGLISQQQSLSRSYLKQSEIQNNQIKKMMEHRMQQLNRRHIQYVKQSEQLKNSNHKLAKMLISFEKVNHELVEELEKMTNEKKKAERQFYNIGNNYFKTLQLLYDKKLIQMDYTKQQQNLSTSKKSSSEYKTYILLDKSSKPVVLGRFKYQTNVPNPKQKYASQSLQQSMSEELRKYNDRYGHPVKELQNVLTRFWQKKQDDLQMKGIINSLIHQTKIKDSCVGTSQTDLIDFSCQFPQNGQNYVEKLLKDVKDQLNVKFGIERQQFQTELQKKQAIFQRWKTSAQQMLEKNKVLHQNNLKLTQNLKKAKQGSSQLVKQIDALAKNIEELKNQIQGLKIDLQRSKTEEQSAKTKEKLAISQRETMKSQLERQKQNNRMLVRGNLQMKQKVQKFDIRYNNLLKSVKGVSPWLQKFMMEIDKSIQEIDVGLLKTVSNKIEQHLSQYVTKDSSLFMTRLS